MILHSMENSDNTIKTNTVNNNIFSKTKSLFSAMDFSECNDLFQSIINNIINDNNIVYNSSNNGIKNRILNIIEFFCEEKNYLYYNYDEKQSIISQYILLFQFLIDKEINIDDILSMILQIFKKSVDCNFPSIVIYKVMDYFIEDILETKDINNIQKNLTTIHKFITKEYNIFSHNNAVQMMENTAIYIKILRKINNKYNDSNYKDIKKNYDNEYKSVIKYINKYKSSKNKNFTMLIDVINEYHEPYKENEVQIIFDFLDSKYYDIVFNSILSMKKILYNQHNDILLYYIGTLYCFSIQTMKNNMQLSNLLYIKNSLDFLIKNILESKNPLDLKKNKDKFFKLFLFTVDSIEEYYNAIIISSGELLKNNSISRKISEFEHIEYNLTSDNDIVIEDDECDSYVYINRTKMNLFKQYINNTIHTKLKKYWKIYSKNKNLNFIEVTNYFVNNIDHLYVFYNSKNINHLNNMSNLLEFFYNISMANVEYNFSDIPNLMDNILLIAYDLQENPKEQKEIFSLIEKIIIILSTIYINCKFNSYIIEYIWNNGQLYTNKYKYYKYCLTIFKDNIKDCNEKFYNLIENSFYKKIINNIEDLPYIQQAIIPLKLIKLFNSNSEKYKEIKNFKVTPHFSKILRNVKFLFNDNNIDINEHQIEKTYILIKFLNNINKYFPSIEVIDNFELLLVEDREYSKLPPIEHDNYRIYGKIINNSILFTYWLDYEPKIYTQLFNLITKTIKIFYNNNLCYNYLHDIINEITGYTKNFINNNFNDNSHKYYCAFNIFTVYLNTINIIINNSSIEYYKNNIGSFLEKMKNILFTDKYTIFNKMSNINTISEKYKNFTLSEVNNK